MKTILEQQLEGIAKVYRDMNLDSPRKFLSMEEFVLSYGKIYKPRHRTEQVPVSTVHECFRNSIELLYTSNDYTYVEGYMFCHVIPIYHAWCIDKSGNIIDPTIEKPQSNWVYMGVAFKTDFVLKTITERGIYGIIDNPEQKFPLLRGLHEKSIIKCYNALMTPTNILASTIGMEYSDLKDYRYQPSKFKVAIYAIGDDYFTICKKAPPVIDGISWSRYKDDGFTKNTDYVIWHYKI